MSKDGLLGTNWHCADPCVARIQARAVKGFGPDHPHSRIKETGYVAADFDEELICPGGEALVTTAITNVSDRFSDLLEDPRLNPQELAERTRRRKEAIRGECMEGRDDVVCQVKFMNNEPQPFYLFEYHKFTEVRLVWAVPNIIGGFGGNTDNWEYPRHSGDFAFLRVYQDGKPFRPEYFVPASTAGVKPGDPQFILGFPGKTERNISSYAVDFMDRVDLRYRHRVYGALTGTIEAMYDPPKNSPYGSSWLYLENYFENFKRKADMIRELGIVDEKQKLERRKAPDSADLRRIQTIYAEAAVYHPTRFLLDFMASRRSPAKSFLSAAYIWEWSTQPEADAERSDERFKSWRRNRLLATLDSADDITTWEGEQALMATYFELADALPVRIEAFDALKVRTQQHVADCFQDPETVPLSCGGLYRMTVYEQMADLLFEGTRLAARDDSPEERIRARLRRQEMFGMSPGELVETGDAMLLVAKQVVEQLHEMKSDWELAAPYEYELEFLHHRVALQVGYDTPDANATIRFTLSRVQDEYAPIYKEGTFPYSTTLSTLVGRDRFLPEGAEEYEEFLVPDPVKAAQRNLAGLKEKFFYDEGLGDVPVNFITNHTITGGNSGSGVFDADGKIVGFAFDGTPESILSDVRLHPSSRTIIVDIRYPGFLGTEVFPDAKRVLKEIGLPAE
jgi:hypothetical protein